MENKSKKSTVLMVFGVVFMICVMTAIGVSFTSAVQPSTTQLQNTDFVGISFSNSDAINTVVVSNSADSVFDIIANIKADADELIKGLTVDNVNIADNDAVVKAATAYKIIKEKMAHFADADYMLAVDERIAFCNSLSAKIAEKRVVEADEVALLRAKIAAYEADIDARTKKRDLLDKEIVALTALSADDASEEELMAIIEQLNAEIAALNEAIISLRNEKILASSEISRLEAEQAPLLSQVKKQNTYIIIMGVFTALICAGVILQIVLGIIGKKGANK